MGMHNASVLSPLRLPLLTVICTNSAKAHPHAHNPQNLMKGYIARERGIVVLSKGATGAFPGTGV